MGKHDREKRVLLGLVDYYIKTGRPVGSNTLKETGFGELSSATIRNYFARLEEEGYLSQPHASGGRVPTDLAYRFYASEYLDKDEPLSQDPFAPLQQMESREIAALLQESAEVLSQVSNCAIFMSAPRFDHDFIVDFKLLPLDARRCLCVLITDFGIIHTETVQLPYKLSSFAVKRMESYFHARLTGLQKPALLDKDEEDLAQGIYNELMVRYIVGYSNFIDEEIYRTGFSRLLTYPDFQDPTVLATSLALFENAHSMRLLLRECMALKCLKFWIGDDLAAYTPTNPNCTVLAVPYYINRSPVGAIGALGPTRLPYRLLFSYLNRFSICVSEMLTRNVYKYKITYRQPEKGSLYLPRAERLLIGQSLPMLLEDKRQS
jgi:heat-inducible transcriptional repressor